MALPSRFASVRWFGLPLSDCALAGTLMCFAQADAWSGNPHGSRAASVVAAVLVPGSIAIRRRAPLAMVVLAMAAVVAQSLLAAPSQSVWLIVAVIVIEYSVAWGMALRPALGGGLLGLAGIAVNWASAPGRNAGGGVFAVLLVALPWLAGRAVYVRQHQAEALELRALRLERERGQTARAAILGERSRIARELHDLVAHAVSLMVVTAEAADAVLDERPTLAHTQLGMIQRTGREALAEMSRLVGMLREDTAALEPRPGVAQLETLLTQMRAAGLSVELQVEGQPRPLSAGLDLAVYRIVQEGLTNTLKHAGPAASSTILLRYQATELAVEVLDDGRGGQVGPNGGHGLIGMRERIDLYGGTLRVGTRAGGGLRLLARLPLEPDLR